MGNSCTAPWSLGCSIWELECGGTGFHSRASDQEDSRPLNAQGCRVNSYRNHFVSLRFIGMLGSANGEEDVVFVLESQTQRLVGRQSLEITVWSC